MLSLGIDVPDSGGSGTMSLDISITDLNEPQDIAEPEDAQPFDQLLGQLGGLGALGAACRAPAPARRGGQDADGGAAGGDFEAYSKCLEEAGNDVDKARACADLLAP